MSPEGWGLVVLLAMAVVASWVRTVILERRLAGMVPRPLVNEMLDRVEAKNPQDFHQRRMAENLRESPRKSPERPKMDYGDPKARRQPSSHAHIPELQQFDQIHIESGVAKCYAFTGDSSIVSIPEESYWKMVASHAGRS